MDDNIFKTERGWYFRSTYTGKTVESVGPYWHRDNAKIAKHYFENSCACGKLCTHKRTEEKEKDMPYEIIEEWSPDRESNPICFILAGTKVDTGWYFYAETWTHRYGPFVSYSEAAKALKSYALDLDNTSGYDEWSKEVFAQAGAK